MHDPDRRDDGGERERAALVDAATDGHERPPHDAEQREAREQMNREVRRVISPEVVGSSDPRD